MRGLGVLLQQKAEPAAEAQAVQQGGGEQHYGANDGHHYDELEALVIVEYVAEQKLGQGGDGHLEQTCYGHGGKGPPGSDPPDPPGPQHAAQHGAEGAEAEADEDPAGKGVIQRYVERADDQRGGEQGGQLLQAPQAVLIQDDEQVGHQDGVGHRGT